MWPESCPIHHGLMAMRSPGAPHLSCQPELVDESMVAPTQQAGVGEVGFATIGPMDDVVPVAPIGRPVAAREAAVLVSNDERAAERSGHRAGAAADVDRLGPRVQEHSGYGAVA